MNTIHRKIWNLIRGGSFHGYLRTASGYPLTLTGCMNEYPVSLSASGNTVQDGTPAPDNPVEVKGCGERTANLFSFKEWLKYIKSSTNPISNGTYTATNETFTIVGKSNVDCYTITYYANSYRVSVKSNTTYKLTWTAVGDIGNVYVFVNSKQAAGYTFLASNTTGTMTFTTPADASYLNLRVGVTGINKTCTYSDFQFNTLDDYEPYGYKVPVVMSGKNLFDVYGFSAGGIDSPSSKRILTNAYGTTINTTEPGNSITVVQSNGEDKIAFDNGYFCIGVSGLIYGATYTLCFDIELSDSSLTKPTYISVIANGGNKSGAYPMYIKNGKCYGKFEYGQSTSVPSREFIEIRLHGASFTACNFMILPGDCTGTLPPYEPYHEPQTFPIYTDAPLYGNGTISDTVELDVERKKAMLTQRYGVVSFDGSESWKDGGGTAEAKSIRYQLALTDSTPCDTGRGFATSNCFRLLAQSGTSSGAVNGFTINIGNIYIKSDGIQTIDEFKTWLSEQAAAGTPLTVVYQLASPTTTDISDKIDWDSIPKFWRGTVIITADTTVTPTEIITQYYADKPEEVN